MAAAVQSQSAVPTPTLSPPTSFTPVSAASSATSVDEQDAVEENFDTIDHLLQSRAKGRLGDEPIVAYPSFGTNYIYYSPKQLDAFVETASIHYAKAIPQRRSSEDPVQVVGLLGPSGFEYLITLLALSRLGHTVLLLSTRIAEDAYVSLVENTKASFLVTHTSFHATGAKVAQRTGINLQPLLSREDFDNVTTGTVRLPPAELDGTVENKHVCWIIHSSGSTGHPKPIYQTHAGALKNYANNFGLCGFITLPLFHAHGISCLFRAVHSQKLIYLYNAELPLTAPHLLTTLQEHQDIQVLYAVPYALKLLSESPEGLEVMARLELVMFGGSACPKPIGDKLVQSGVRLISHYGTTETGQLMTSFREREDPDWDYVRPGPTLLPYIRWEEQMPGIYELCVLEGWPSKVASNRSDNSYATKDLFEKHPTTPNAWRYYARLDDTLVLENGEKANPLVIEGVARNDPNVAEAIAFGANKPRLGLFLIPAENTSCKTAEELIDAVYPAIERCNADSPAYAYISREMIRVLPPDAVYRKTDKGTVIRSAFYRDYQNMIDEVYDVEDATGDQILEGEDLLGFLRAQLLAVAPSINTSMVEDTTDLFSLGIDSLQSIRLRSAIMRTLDLGQQKLSQNFVFENPSLQAMANELTRLRLGQGPRTEIPVEERMQSLIDKYGSGFKVHVPAFREETGEHVIVTGATGSLGAHIIAQLAKRDDVRTIFCLVRASSRYTALKRVRQSLRARALSSELGPLAEHKIIALPSDLSIPTLGLDEATYAQLTQSVTTVMHCAWSVNFNWSLESFEASCIAGTRHLLDLCLNVRSSNPARFSFCSSVSTVARTPGNWVPETLPESLSYAQGMGYAQSKLVTEHVVNRAARVTGMTARVLRSGQIIADTVHGIWNATEAIPMMFQTAETIGALPQLDDLLSWTPVDVLAASVIDLTLAPVANDVLNVTNPNLNHWGKDLLPLLRQAGLRFETLSPREWVRRLQQSSRDPDVNPPIKLVEFFASKYDKESPSRVLLYDTKQAQAAAPALRQAGGLTLDLVRRFVSYFRRQWTKTILESPREVIFLTGPCGCGKSTAAQALAQRFCIPVIEGDDLHSPASRAKMANGIPLEDRDRWDWLAHIRGAVMDRLQHSTAPAVAVTCSALRTVYRDELRRLSDLFDFPVTVTFVLLSVLNGEQLKERVAARSAVEAHYMQAKMVESQLHTLESPGPSESDVIVLDSSRSKEKMIQDVEETGGGILSL
ncbi:acetyl-CoA synthetase-like protein [Aspergillus homomorphus CBS 101889]|uniref:gluconokinase n=1 Tax=Aspergillus homomorphus (strain CBS 101889) TaxID=1450537 RepID=A0A395HYM6_ASPHC|nr:acetyl-CoA synthetase-like protein [Aspergillus homomorphus CBS 101889]RAL12493.1 acetyl-CoA synthetase-like protein [Aspergillus homomorphus CBS 101889]